MHTHLLNLYRQYPAGRLLAVDVFRGLMVAAMILVNNPGSWGYVYAPMLHADWHGWTLADLVFPFFLFIVGMSIVMALEPENRPRPVNAALYKNIVVRSAKLFALGLFLNLFYFNFYQAGYNWFSDMLPNVRIMGVLQRIAIVYLCTSLLVLNFQLRGRVLWLMGLLAGYSVLILHTSYGDSNQYSGLLEHGNSLPAYMDSLLLGASHVYYNTATPFVYDPEGLLSTLPSIATCLSGALAATWFQRPDIHPSTKLRRLAASGLAAAVIGQLLHTVLPINKTLWTPTFVLLSSGLAAVSLAGLIVLLKSRPWRLWAAPFAVCGLNAITFYTLQGVLAGILSMVQMGGVGTLKDWLFENWFQPLFGGYNGSILFAFVFLILVYLPLQIMHDKRIFFKV